MWGNLSSPPACLRAVIGCERVEEKGIGYERVRKSTAERFKGCLSVRGYGRGRRKVKSARKYGKGRRYRVKEGG